MKVHLGTLLAGLIFLVVGVAFTLEALGYWSLELSDLRYLGPAALIAVGLAMVGGSLTRNSTSGTSR